MGDGCRIAGPPLASSDQTFAGRKPSVRSPAIARTEVGDIAVVDLAMRRRHLPLRGQSCRAVAAQSAKTPPCVPPRLPQGAPAPWTIAQAGQATLSRWGRPPGFGTCGWPLLGMWSASLIVPRSVPCDRPDEDPRPFPSSSVIVLVRRTPAPAPCPSTTSSAAHRISASGVCRYFEHGGRRVRRAHRRKPACRE